MHTLVLHNTCIHFQRIKAFVTEDFTHTKKLFLKGKHSNTITYGKDSWGQGVFNPIQGDQTPHSKGQH